MGSVRTSILGRPRPLPPDRRAHPGYTLDCEEPAKPQEAGRTTVVLHSDGHVAHEFAQLFGYTVERLAHHHLELLGINIDHAASV